MITANNIAFTCFSSDICLRYSIPEIAYTSLFIAFESTYALRNLDCPITIEQYRKLIDMDIITEISNLFYKYLHNDAEQDPDFRKTEQYLLNNPSYANTPSSSTSLLSTSSFNMPVTLSSTSSSQDINMDIFNSSTNPRPYVSSLSQQQLQNSNIIEEVSFDLGQDSIMMPQLADHSISSLSSSMPNMNNNINISRTSTNSTNITVTTPSNVTTLSEFKNRRHTFEHQQTNLSSVPYEEPRIYEEGEEGEDNHIALPTLS